MNQDIFNMLNLPNGRFCHENEFYRSAVKLARFQPGTYTLENAQSFASAQRFYDLYDMYRSHPILEPRQ